jgi:hypothetical protein
VDMDCVRSTRTSAVHSDDLKYYSWFFLQKSCGLRRHG